MLRPRMYDCRVSGLPEAIGKCSSDFTALAAAVNEAQERLMNDPLAPEEGWWGGWVRMVFNLSYAEPYFITPREVARVILLDVCKHPVKIRNSFYEFLEFGPGYQPAGYPTVSSGQKLVAYERETVVLAVDLPATSIIRAYPVDPNDAGRGCVVEGEDANDKVIYRTDGLTGKAALGEKLTFAVPFSDTTNTFSSITGIQKQKTFGEIQFFAVDPTTLVETPILVMAPGETTAQYRKYFVNGLPASEYCCGATASSVVQVTAMCKLDFIPVECDADYLTIPSVPAIIDECMSIRYGRMDNAGAQAISEKKHANALRILFGQLTHFMGNERPAIRRSIFGSNCLPSQPV